VALAFEALFFLLLIAMVVRLVFGVYGLLGRWVRRATGSPWPGALASALIFAWGLAVTFPLLSG